MDLSQAINQPLAVILILVVIFGFAMMGFDKMTYLFKTLTKRTPMDKMSGTYEKMSNSYEQMSKVIEKVADNIQEHNMVLKQLSASMAHHEAMATERHKQLMRELDRK